MERVYLLSLRPCHGILSITASWEAGFFCSGPLIHSNAGERSGAGVWLVGRLSPPDGRHRQRLHLQVRGATLRPGT